MADKAYLVLDAMPRNCSDCPLCVDNPESMLYEPHCVAHDLKKIDILSEGGRPSFCKLKSEPECHLTWFDNEDDNYDLGYNAALKDIFGGGEKDNE